MRSEKARVTSRREFVANTLAALGAATTWQIRANQVWAMNGQSDSTTSNLGGTTRSLTFDVFLSPSLPVVASASDLPPGEKERPWQPISSTLISGERDAVLVDTPITVEQANFLTPVE